MSFLAAVDVGGHNIRTVLAEGDGTILAREERTIDRDAKDAGTNVRRIVDAINDLLSSRGLDPADLGRIAIGVPSPVDTETGTLVIAPNVPHWINLPLRAMLQEHFPAEILLDNDVNMAALGEYWKGAGADCRNFFFIALGTGIGGGVFVNGQLYRGRNCGAGEIGYLVLQPNQRHRRVGDQGWFESVASGLAIDTAGSQAARSNPSSPLLKLAGSAEAVKSAHVFDAAREGDPESIAILDEAFEYIAMAVVNVTALLDPDVIIVGGGMSGQGERVLQPLREKSQDYGLPIPPLRLSQLGQDAQLLGALYTAVTGKQ